MAKDKDNTKDVTAQKASRQATYLPVRFTKIGQLRPFGCDVFSDPEDAVEWANAQSANSDGERFTVLPIFDYVEVVESGAKEG